MPSKTKLIWIAVGLTISHFFATWFVVLQAWEHDLAARLTMVMLFPARLTGLGGGKLLNTVVMFSNSVLWGLLFTALVALAFWRFPRRKHD